MFCNFVKDFQLQQAKGRMISFWCESSCPSGPCMSPFCCSPLNAEFTNLRLVKSHLREFTKGAAFLPHSHHPNFLPNTGLQMSKFKSRFPGNNSNQCIAMDYKYDAVSENPRPSTSPPTLTGSRAPASYRRTCRIMHTGWVGSPYSLWQLPAHLKSML